MTKSGSATPTCPKDQAAAAWLLRWYVVTIEKVLNEAYATSPRKCGDLVAILQQTIKDLYKTGKGKARKRRKTGEDDECPPGYEKCDDGMCAPMCSIEGPEV